MNMKKMVQMLYMKEYEAKNFEFKGETLRIIVKSFSEHYD